MPCSEDLEKKIVLFGVHACDVYGLNILDQVFGGKYPDLVEAAAVGRVMNGTTDPIPLTAEQPDSELTVTVEDRLASLGAE